MSFLVIYQFTSLFFDSSKPKFYPICWGSLHDCISFFKFLIDYVHIHLFFYFSLSFFFILSYLLSILWAELLNSSLQLSLSFIYSKCCLLFTWSPHLCSSTRPPTYALESGLKQKTTITEKYTDMTERAVYLFILEN